MPEHIRQHPSKIIVLFTIYRSPACFAVSALNLTRKISDLLSKIRVCVCVVGADNKIKLT